MLPYRSKFPKSCGNADQQPSLEFGRAGKVRFEREVCSLCLTRLCRLGNGLFRVPKGVLGVLVRLFGKFVSGQVISFAVGSGGSGMGVRRKVVKFCGAVMCALWHGVLLLAWMRNLPAPTDPRIELEHSKPEIRVWSLAGSVDTL
jgi:hypothetical protein